MAAESSATVLRHTAIDRIFHWVTAVTMTALLLSGLLPVVGIRFAWLEVHWISGVLLTAAVLLHVGRVLTIQGLRAMQLRPRDLAEFSGARPGKYSVQQKLIHLGWTVAVLAAIGTGIALMIKAGTPFFQRDPYIFTLQTWGVLTVLHDLATLLAVFLILVHVYFGLLPEKRMYLRSMIGGRITRAELAANHDPERVARGE